MRDIALLSILGLGMIEGETKEAVITDCDIQCGLLKYRVHPSPSGYVLCNAGDYQITELTFDTFQEVLDYINNGEKEVSSESK